MNDNMVTYITRIWNLFFFFTIKFSRAVLLSKNNFPNQGYLEKIRIIFPVHKIN